MKLQIVEGDCSDHTGDAIVVTVDGLADVAQPPRGGPELVKLVDRRVLGKVGHDLLRKCSEPNLIINEICDQVRFPLSDGEAISVELPEEEAPYRLMVLAAILPHLGEAAVDRRSRRGIVQSAFARALEICHAAGVERLVTPLFTGGWRLTPGEALEAMMNVLLHPPCQLPEIVICVRPGDAGDLRQRAVARGLKVQ
jgi:hypothetical protein